MDRQLEAIVGDLHAAGERLRALYAAVPYDAWSQRPTPARWSPGECVAHLNLTSRALLPLLRDGLRRARAHAGRSPSPYRFDAIGWVIWTVMAPSAIVKTRTSAAFIPVVDVPVSSLVQDFEWLQSEIIACVREAAGLPIDRVTIVSPFDARLTYNLYSALRLTGRHQHRHLRQAERAVPLRAPVASPLAV